MEGELSRLPALFITFVIGCIFFVIALGILADLQDTYLVHTNAKIINRSIVLYDNTPTSFGTDDGLTLGADYGNEIDSTTFLLYNGTGKPAVNSKNYTLDTDAGTLQLVLGGNCCTNGSTFNYSLTYARETYGIEYNTTRDQAVTGTGNITGWFPTMGTILAAGIVISVLFAGLYFAFKPKGE